MHCMEDDSDTRINHPEKLCDTIVGIIDELENGNIIGEEQASEFRSEIYRSIDTLKE
jgi:hypothetical protein